MKKLLSIAIAVIMLCACAPTAFAESGVMTKRIEFNNPGFIRGMDVSSVISLEKSGVRFYTKNGQEDIFKILSDNGVNYIRARVWNDPYDSEGNGYGGGNNDLNAACEIGRRAAERNMKLLVDFHYSDFWADPGKQKAPKAWQGISLNDKKSALYNFTYNSLREIKSAGADIGMVQIGNETTGGICGEYNRANMAELFKSGSKAVRDFDSHILAVIHFTNPERADSIKSLADYLAEYQVDYDVFATSYYPYWHGSLENLTDVLDYAAEKYDKYAMVAETSYANTLEDTDGHGNTVAKGNNDSGKNLLWDFSCQGQSDAVAAVMNAVNKVKNKKGLGVFYWEGAWISVGDVTGLDESGYNDRYKLNSELWEKFGSGWASSYSSDYDPDDAGHWYGGSAVDNQAFFDAKGMVLPSLDVFRLINKTVKIGDVKRDGRLNISDATLIRKYLAKISDLDSESLRAADTDRDGIVTVKDAAVIQKNLADIPVGHKIGSEE